MSYRKITVDGTTYEYVIGRTKLKIKGLGLYEIAKIGNRLVGTPSRQPVYVVTPGTVAKVIRGEPLPTVLHCNEHNYTTDELVYNPYQHEIKERKIHMINCPTCYAELKLDI
jgi:hypothetical protein